MLPCEKVKSFLSLRILTYNNLACCYRHLGKLATSLGYLRKAVRIGGNRDDTMMEVSTEHLEVTHLNMCAVLSQMGKHREALPHACKAIHHCKMQLMDLRERYEACADSGVEMRALVNGGDGEEDPLLRPLTAGKLLRLQHDKESTLAVAYHNYATELDFSGQARKAKHWYQKAIAVQRGCEQVRGAGGSGKGGGSMIQKFERAHSACVRRSSERHRVQKQKQNQQQQQQQQQQNQNHEQQQRRGRQGHIQGSHLTPRKVGPTWTPLITGSASARGGKDVNPCEGMTRWGLGSSTHNSSTSSNDDTSSIRRGGEGGGGGGRGETLTPRAEEAQAVGTLRRKFLISSLDHPLHQGHMRGAGRERGEQGDRGTSTLLPEEEKWCRGGKDGAPQHSKGGQLNGVDAVEAKAATACSDGGGGSRGPNQPPLRSTGSISSQSIVVYNGTSKIKTGGHEHAADRTERTTTTTTTTSSSSTTTRAATIATSTRPLQHLRESTSEWLTRIGLGQYVIVFEDQGMDRAAMLALREEALSAINSILVEAFGMTRIGDRLKFKRALEHFGTEKSWSQQSLVRTSSSTSYLLLFFE